MGIIVLAPKDNFRNFEAGNVVHVCHLTHQNPFENMENHRNLSDNAFLEQVVKCELAPVDFTHEAHLRLAYLFIQRNGIDSAIEQVQASLKKFVAFAGATDKYNTTLTVAAVKAVYHFMQRSASENFRDFISEFPRLKNDFKRLMACHYGFDIYRSREAKERFMEPDLLSF